MKKLISLIVILFFQSIFSQNFDNRLYSYNIDEIKYYKYENEKIFATIEDISNVDNSSPEKLIQSVISCKNKEWEILNTLGGEANADVKSIEEYNQIKRMDKTKNYIELINKIEFKIDSISTAIIKFNLISASFQKPMVGIIVMQQYNNKWFKTNTKMVNNIALPQMKLKPDLFDNIVNNNFDTEELKKLKSKIMINNHLDFNALSAELNSWYQKNPKMLKYFKDENSIL